MRNPRTKGSDGNAELETICQPYRFFCGVLYYPTCAVCGLFLCAALACKAAPENTFFKTVFFEGNVVGIVSGYPISWKIEDVLRK